VSIPFKMGINKAKWKKILQQAKQSSYDDDVSQMVLSEMLQPYCERRCKQYKKEIMSCPDLAFDGNEVSLIWPRKLGITAGLYKFGKKYFPVISAGGCEDKGFEDGWKKPEECLAYALCQCLTYHLINKYT